MRVSDNRLAEKETAPVILDPLRREPKDQRQSTALLRDKKRPDYFFFAFATGFFAGAGAGFFARGGA